MLLFPLGCLMLGECLETEVGKISENLFIFNRPSNAENYNNKCILCIQKVKTIKTLWDDIDDGQCNHNNNSEKKLRPSGVREENQKQNQKKW
jgi:hypothetical protein